MIPVELLVEKVANGCYKDEDFEGKDTRTTVVFVLEISSSVQKLSQFSSGRQMGLSFQ
jgi:hypothetical protein